jgi:hypothetical protein
MIKRSIADKSSKLIETAAIENTTQHDNNNDNSLKNCFVCLIFICRWVCLWRPHFSFLFPVLEPTEQVFFFSSIMVQFEINSSENCS